MINKHLNKIIWVAFLINLIIIYIFKPNCPWKSNFNIYCAGCGATRMVESLLKLDLYQAFRYNPLLFILLIVFLIYGLYILINILLKKEYYKLQTREYMILLIVVIIYMILRNIPLFYYLRPTVLIVL